MFKKYNELCNYLKQSTSPELCLGPDQRLMMMFFCKNSGFHWLTTFLKKFH